MPHLQISPETETAAHQLARRRAEARVYTTPVTPLQQAHFAAISRANKVCASHPGVLSKYALGEILATIEHDMITHGELGHIAEAVTLNRVLARLQTLIQV